MRKCLALALFACAFVVYAQEPAKPEPGFSYLYQDDAGVYWRQHMKGSISGDISGDGVDDSFEAWNVYKLEDSTFMPVPEKSGVWANYSEDVTMPDGSILPAESWWGPSPQGTVFQFEGDWDTPGTLYATVLQPGADAADTFAVAPPGVPESQDPLGPPDDPIPNDQVGAVGTGAVYGMSPCNYYGCGYYRGGWRIGIQRDLQPTVQAVEIRIFSTWDGSLVRTLNTTMDDWHCLSSDHCEWFSDWCEVLPGLEPPYNAVFDYTLHILTSTGLYSTVITNDGSSQGAMWCP